MGRKGLYLMFVIIIKNQRLLILIMVLEMGFEPTAYWLRVSCSTVGATPA